ncbi:cobalamin biosynthesis protein CobW [Streptomyces noursei ZPM]|uniref:Cobalamin biosynthesis protein CobW n=1 Tax=Streptomyces noursei TaxID=1971 RepID=A0A401R8T2_STRNR|nr:CobW family GTP-binding protein [Streptomyces noursei]AKA03128.1 cobalamin biosynthesis protein CobW [Streptomyces noursei ZPM]EOT03392.1 cobalamin biosynthesis protein CobW [Streptomyces noursei CCRC 11814]EXU91040.1 cobalamin biosynthesis protein CobW [Streptomyces noursei PD-1]UWS74822.1 GTP-binding protein [Streptomyces noursei]GCB94035.1 cobalamin biosynthesis protein CobW [Streptomyces noursei]
MATQQIPVVVLAGFLGSGKTTLLNHLLRAGDGTRIGAIVNDFGSIEIDAMTVAGQVDSMVSLGNGCLCCAVDTSELDDYLERLARPAARIDVIVIEASGLAEPQEIIRMILASDNDRIVYGGLIEVVDAAEFDDTRARHPELDRHVAIADLVVLNKADRIEDEARHELIGRLADLAPGRPVLCTAFGRIDPEMFFDRGPGEDRDATVRQLSFEDLLREASADRVPQRRDEAGDVRDHLGCYACDHDHDHAGHLHAAYESVEFVSSEPMHPRRLMEFLDSRPGGLYRIKGFVHFDVPQNRQKFVLHAVGNFLRFYPEPWAKGEERTTQLVMIGSGIDAPALRKELENCRQLVPEEADENSMWGVLRYVPSREE